MAGRETDRRLAAIFAADVVGYSRLMGLDETGTLRRLKDHRASCIEPAFRRRQGRLVKLTGDGVLAEFQSVANALAAAVEIQRDTAAFNAALPEAQHIVMRIGINLGDVISDGRDIYGEGVNVAARLEALAEPGGITVSQTVHNAAQGHVSVSFEDGGVQVLKNIERPVQVYRVRWDAGAWAGDPPGDATFARSRRRLLLYGGTGAGLSALAAAGWFLSRRPPPPPPARSEPGSNRRMIAIVPFITLGGDDSQTYFTDGIVEDLAIDLGRISTLSVFATGVTRNLAGTKGGAAAEAKGLGADYVIEGTVRLAGERVRVTAQLIDTRNGQQVWGERYDRDLKDIFAVQDDVRQSIVTSLRLTLSPTDRAVIAKTATTSVEAFDLYTRGRAMMTALSPAGAAEARRLFLRAIEIDPAYARAMAQYAETFTGLIDSGFESASTARHAVEIAQRAVAMDPTLPQTHWSLGRALRFAGEADASVDAMRKSIEISPNFADGHAWLAQTLLFDGRIDEAEQHLRRAFELNPAYPFWYLAVEGNCRFHRGDYEGAVVRFREAMARNPSSQFARRGLIAALGLLGRREEGEWELAEAQVSGANLSISGTARLSQAVFRSAAFREQVIDGLHRAGVPD